MMQIQRPQLHASPEFEYKDIPQSELTNIVWGARSSVCQVETLDFYSVSHDDPVYQAYLKGIEPSETDLTGYNYWFDHAKEAIERGVEATRIHLLPDTFTDYLNYEIDYGYRKWCMPCGEQVYIIRKSENPELTKMAFRDFYVIDDARILAPIYTKDNEYVGLSEVISQNGIDHFISLKQKLLQAAVPLPQSGSVW